MGYASKNVCPPVIGHPLFLTGKVLGLGHCSPNFAHDGYCDNARGRDEVFNGTLGWAVTFKSLFMLHLDLQRFPGLAAYFIGDYVCFFLPL